MKKLIQIFDRLFSRRLASKMKKLDREVSRAEKRRERLEQRQQGLKQTSEAGFDSEERKQGRLHYSIGFGILSTAAAFILILFLSSVISAIIPDKRHVTFRVTAPAAPTLTAKTIPQLKIRFNRSVAALDEINGDVSDQISLSGEVDGVWIWETERLLVFSPSQHWPIDSSHTIKFSKKLFPSYIKLDKYSAKFKTAPFRIDVANYEFYVDPRDASKKQLVADFSMNYPVNEEDFKKHVTIKVLDSDPDDSWYRQKSELDLEFIFDNSGDYPKAYVKSENLPVPLENVDTRLTLSAGSRAAGTDIKSRSTKSSNEIIYGSEHYVSIKNSSLSFVREESYEYRQLLAVSSRGKINPDLLKDEMTLYLLPRKESDLKRMRNGDAIDENFKDQSYDSRELSKELLAKSEKISLEVIRGVERVSDSNLFEYRIEPGRQLYLKINKGTPFHGDYKLSQLYGNIMRVPRFPAELRIQSEGTVLSSKGEKKLSIYSSNINNIECRLYKILPDQINHLITQSNADLKNFRFTNYRFNEQNISLKYTEKFRFDTFSRSGKPNFFAIDLDKYISSKTGNRDKAGIFMVEVEGKAASSSYKDRRIVMVSDLGFIIKKNVDGTRDIFMQSMSSGTPASGVKVQVLGKNGLPLVTRTTDASGHCEIGALNGFHAEKEPVAFVATSGNDIAFSSWYKHSSKLEYSSFDVSGVHFSNDKRKLKAYLYTDRGMYRPGDEVRFASIVKSSDWNPSVKGTPMKVSVTDPGGTRIFQKEFNLAAAGYNDFKVPTSPVNRTGEYAIKLYYRIDDVYHSAGSARFKLEEFQPDRMKIKPTFEQELKKGWLKEDQIQCNINLTNLYGVPAASYDIKASYDLIPASLYSPAHPGYRFITGHNGSRSSSHGLGSKATDSKGNTQFNIDLRDKRDGIYRLTVTAAGVEKGGGRSVTDSISTIVSPLDNIIGYKFDEGDLNWISKGRKRTLHLVAIDNNLDPIEMDGFSLKLTREEYHTVLKEMPNGTYKYQSVKKIVEVSNTPFTIGKKGYRFDLKTEVAGKHKMAITDKNGLNLVNLSYTVAGSGDLSRSLDKNVLLELSVKNQDYEAGDALQINVKAPFTGAGLITIEKEKVLTHKWFRTNKLTSIQTITVPSGIDGNAYVNVIMLRDFDSSKIYTSPMSYGVGSFYLSLNKRKNAINLDVPKESKPGKDFKIRYRSTAPSKIILYAVDKGIHQVAKYRKPDPLALFFRKQALDVMTWQTIDQLLPDYSYLKRYSEFGGGGWGAAEAELLKAKLNPFRRKVPEPVAFWSGIVESGPDWSEVTYRVPDYFNGTLNVMAVAVSDEKIGVQSKEALVRSDYIISPNIPFSAAPGDKIKATVRISSSGGSKDQAADVPIAIRSSSNLKLTGKTEHLLRLKKYEEAVIDVEFEATHSLGNSWIEIKAGAGEKESSYRSTLSLRPAYPYITELSSGRLEKRESFSKEVNRDTYDEFRDFEFTGSAIPLGFSSGIKRYLSDYPYGCSEQLISKALPWSAMAETEPFEVSLEDAQDYLDQAISKLTIRQSTTGHIGYWNSQDESFSFIDFYAGMLFLEAKEKGLSIPPELYESNLKVLREFANSRQTELQAFRLQAMACYVLIRNGEVMTSQVEKIVNRLNERDIQWKKDLTAGYLAACYGMLMADEEARKVFSTFIRSVKNYKCKNFYYYYSNRLVSSQALYLLLNHFPDKYKQYQIELMDKMINEIMLYGVNTIYSSWVLLSLEKMVEDKMDFPEEFALTFINKAKEKSRAQFGDQVIEKSLIPADTRQLKLKNNSDNIIYYQVVTAGYDKSWNKERNPGEMDLIRQILDKDEKPVKTIRLGDELTVRLRLRSSGKESYSNVAVTDILPSCFEIDLSSKLSGFCDYSDRREDRYLIFTSVGRNYREFTYNVKVISQGDFVLPPLFAEAMYDPSKYALGAESRITVLPSREGQ